MSNGSKFFVAIDDSRLKSRVDGWPSKLRKAVFDEVTRLAIMVQSFVKSPNLSGLVLHNRTGNLRRSINQEVTQSGNRTEAVVGTNVEYAAAHEYGFNGNVTVKAHLRVIKQAWGKQIAAKTVNVRAFTRAQRTPERSFLRSALARLRPQITGGLERAVKGALQ